MHSLAALRLRLHLILAVGGVRPVGTPASAAFDSGCGGCASCRHSGFGCASCRPYGVTASAAARPRSRNLRSHQTAHPPQPESNAAEIYAAARPHTPHSQNQMQPKSTQPPDYAPEIYISPCSRNLRSRQTMRPTARSHLRCKESAQLLSRALCARTTYLVHLLICVRAQLLVYILFIFCAYFYII